MTYVKSQQSTVCYISSLVRHTYTARFILNLSVMKLSKHGSTPLLARPIIRLALVLWVKSLRNVFACTFKSLSRKLSHISKAMLWILNFDSYHLVCRNKDVNVDCDWYMTFKNMNSNSNETNPNRIMFQMLIGGTLPPLTAAETV